MNNADRRGARLTSGSDGSATIPALSLTGTYTVSRVEAGLRAEERQDITLRAGETATLKVKLLVGGGESRGHRLRHDGRRARGPADRPPARQPARSTRRRSSAARSTTLPLLNSAFRQGKGTGDLFVNATYFITGAGSRRTTTFMLDGANNDEGWGRQTMLATVPIGAIQEMTVLSNAFSAEFGWTSGPALNIVTKSGTNALHGEGLYLSASRRLAGEDVLDRRASARRPCRAASRRHARRRSTRWTFRTQLKQVSGSIGGPIVKDKTFFFATADYTRQDRTTFLSPTLPAFVLPADGSLDYTGHYRQYALQRPARSQAHADADVDVALQRRSHFTTTIRRTRSAARTRRASRAGTRAARGRRRSITPRCSSSNLLNEARFAYLNGDPVTLWEAQTLSTTYTRAGSVPFTIGQSRVVRPLRPPGAVRGHAVVVARQAHLRFGGSVIRHTSGGTGSEPGTAMLGTFTFLNTTTAPFDQLTLADVQKYTQPISFGISSYELKQWLSRASCRTASA